MKQKLLSAVVGLGLIAFAGPASAGMAEAEKWVDDEFQPSSLSREEQLQEMEWFVKAAEPFKGMNIKVGNHPDPRI